MNRGHIPKRRCIGCRSIRPKGEMIKFKLEDGVLVVASKKDKLPGRGCYTCPNKRCFEQALKKGSFARAFRCNKVVLPSAGALLNGLETEGIMDDDVDR